MTELEQAQYETDLELARHFGVDIKVIRGIRTLRKVFREASGGFFYVVYDEKDRTVLHTNDINEVNDLLTKRPDYKLNPGTVH